jgi:hypothetical protein
MNEREEREKRRRREWQNAFGDFYCMPSIFARENEQTPFVICSSIVLTH